MYLRREAAELKNLPRKGVLPRQRYQRLPGRPPRRLADELPEIDPEAWEIYSAALEAMFSQNIWPDGKEIDEEEYKSRGDFSENQFAVCDVDNDGREELLLHVTTASMAGMFGRGYMTMIRIPGKITEEFVVFPAVTYYDNGTLKSEWSHNQGRGAKTVAVYPV